MLIYVLALYLNSTKLCGSKGVKYQQKTLKFWTGSLSRPAKYNGLELIYFLFMETVVGL